MFLKIRLLLLLSLLLQGLAHAQQSEGPTTPLRIDDGVVIIETKGAKPPPPLFFTAEARAHAHLTHSLITQEITVRVAVLQGKPDALTLSLHGNGEVTAVEGDQVRYWGVRQGTGEEAHHRYLEIRPQPPEGETPLDAFEFKVRTEQSLTSLPTDTDLLTLGPGDAVGYSASVDLLTDGTVSVAVGDSPGWDAVKVSDDEEARRFRTTGTHNLSLRLEAQGAAAASVTLASVRLNGTVQPDTHSVGFVLSGEATVRDDSGGRLRILSGHAALRALPEDAPYTIHLVSPGNASPFYELRFSQAGTFPVELHFDARLLERGEWTGIQFSVLSNAIIPMRLAGLPEETRFDGTQPVFPTRADGDWLGFLPPNGAADTSWRPGRDEAEGKLFFATEEQTEISVSAGLLRQVTLLRVNVLQGKLNELSVALLGDGEILAVEGPHVLGWSVTPGPEETRQLNIPVGQAIEGQATLVLRSQTAVGSFPVTVQPLRLAPEGAVRHSGSLRVGNQGAVRIQLEAIQGLTQLSPEQYPGEVTLTTDASQVYVYRIPASGYRYTIVADQILPEVTVSQIAVYHMGESDRRLEAAIELDIREAPLREWDLDIPEDYAVVSVQGAEVADHVLASEATDGRRSLKVLFANMLTGRHVIQVQLEKNEAPAAGDWVLPALAYPDAKTVRGHIGVSTTAGFRVLSGNTSRLAEIPLTQFPQQQEALQQTYRLREADWAATMRVEALGQSVQADVFHLYSLKEGMVYGSVLVNYYVVGAPVSSWRLQVPESVGNVAIDGEDVQTWRRDGAEVTVILHEPALGPATLLLTFEQPMGVQGGDLTLGDVVPLDVQGERGFIQVVSPYQVQYTLNQASDNLLSLEASELPAEFRLLSSAPSLVAYQYGARPLQLGMTIQWFQPGETVDKVIDYANISSEVAADGQVATAMQLFVKWRGQQALRLRLPAGATLWDAKVDGQPVNARQDADETVIPLRGAPDSGQQVPVTIRYGLPSSDADHPVLITPASEAPILISEWRVRGERGRVLLPRENAEAMLARPPLTESGFEWLAYQGKTFSWGAWQHAFRSDGPLAAFGFLTRHWTVIVVAILLALASIIGRKTPSRLRASMASMLTILAVWACAFSAWEALDGRRVNLQTVMLISPVITPGNPLAIPLAQETTWWAMVSMPGLIALVVGLVCLRWKAPRDIRPALTMLSIVLLGTGLLAQRPGAPVFYALLGAWLLGTIARHHWRQMKTNWSAKWRASRTQKAKGATASATPLMVLAAGLGLALAGGNTQAAEITPDRLTETWQVSGQRLTGQVDVHLSGKAGDRSPWLHHSAILTSFTPNNDALRVVRRAVEGGVAHDLILDTDGAFSAKATFEVALSKPLSRVAFPTTHAAYHEVTVLLDRPGWEITSPAAVRMAPALGANEEQSGVTMLLGMAGEAFVSFAPRTRDLSSESSQFYVEVAQLFIPRPGVLDGRHRVSVRPSQGRIQALRMRVPTGFTVSDVLLEGMRTWRFDPESQILRVELEAPKAEPFQLAVLTQQGAGGLPIDAVLEPLRVEAAAGEVGMLALAFGTDAQPGAMEATGMSLVNLDDFDRSLLGKNHSLVLHRVYRYGSDPASINVSVTAVEPELRMTTEQTLSLGEERLILSVDLTATITRAGVFQLRFPVPEGLDVEAISGSHLDHWTEAAEGDTRSVVLHLKGQSMGDLPFAISLAGDAPGPQDAWSVPRFTLDGASRATGQLIIAPELGIRAQAVSRRNVSQLDTRRLAQRRTGSLAFQLLQNDWELQLRLEQLAPWVTAQALQEVTLREGQTRTRLALHYQIENAAVRSLRLRLPGLSAQDQDSVHATGEGLSDLVKVTDDPDLWEIRFQRGMLGKVLVSIDYQQPADRTQATEAIAPVALENIRQVTHWVAVRSTGRLELSLEDPDRRWQEADWSTLPHELVNGQESTPPRLFVRAVAPDQALQVRVERHAVAEALKLRVREGTFMTILSSHGAHVTKASVHVEVAEKSPLKVTLPPGASLFNVTVNEQSVAIAQEGETDAAKTYSFYVFPREDGQDAHVTFAFGVYASGEALMTGPILNVPWRNLTWKVVLPNGYHLQSHEGNLAQLSDGQPVRFDMDQYMQQSAQAQRSQTAKATQLLERANDWLRQGQQDKALEALQNAAKSSSLDAASNEDARVQLRQLQREQAVLGLNTRRQLLAMENRIETPSFARNAQMEQAAAQNPFLKGALNYDPQQVDQLLLGNTAEENSALKRMASRLVSQQSEADPGLRGIDVTLPARGELVTFHRAVHVADAQPLQLRLTLKPTPTVSWWWIIGSLAFLAALAWLSRGRDDATA